MRCPTPPQPPSPFTPPPSPSGLSHLLSLAPVLHKRFARYDEYDEACYTAFEEQLKAPPPIQPREDELITASSTDTGDWKRISGTVRESVSYFHKTTNNAAWGKAVATIDAPASRVLAHRFCIDDYDSVQNHATKEGPNSFRSVVAVPYSRTNLLANVVKFGLGVSDRVFCTAFCWREEADGSFILAFAPLTDYKTFNSATVTINNSLQTHPHPSKAVRATIRGFWRIKPLALTVCELTYAVQVELGGSIPKEVRRAA